MMCLCLRSMAHRLMRVVSNEQPKPSFKMKLTILLILLLPITFADGQQPPKRIGVIDFFGYTGIDVGKIKAALPIHEGDEFNIETAEDKITSAREIITKLIGHPPTDISVGCCDSQGNWNIEFGLSGKKIAYHPSPKGTVRLPASALTLYERYMNGVMEAVQKGEAQEDRSKGYALTAYPPLQAVQLEMRAYAIKHSSLIRNVLMTSASEKQRIAASALLGYAQNSPAQIQALIHASRDRQETVRNNATRALLVLAESSPKIAARIPPDGFIEMLLSGTWTDLNKASLLLSILARSREPSLLAKFQRKEALDRLIEIARWRTGHAEPAQYILGCVAGINEKELEQLIADKNAEAIIKRVK